MSLTTILRPTPLLLLLAFAGQAHAQASAPGMAEPQQDEAGMQAAREATERYYSRIAPQLAASGKPRDLALAATLLKIATTESLQGAPTNGATPSRPSPRDPRIRQWKQLASERAGKDALANALLMQADAADDTPLRTEAAARWRRLEPDNLAPIYFLAGPVDTLLADARTTRRFDLHFYDQVRWMRAALSAHPPTVGENADLLNGEQVPLEEASTSAAMAIVTAVAIPPLQPIRDACRGAALSATPTRRPDCRHVAEVMADRSDNNLVQFVGLGLLKDLATTQQQQQQADVLARQRGMDWRMWQWGKLSAAQLRDGVVEFTRLLGDPAIHGEQDLVARLLTDAGIPLEPPSDWQPPRR